MYAGLIYFCLGVSVVALFPVLPPVSELWLLVFGAALTLSHSTFRPISGLFLGLLLAIANGHLWLAKELPAQLESKSIVLEARITAIPLAGNGRFRLAARVTQGELEGRKLLLSWFGPDPPGAGEIWRLKCRLLRPRGSVNHGLFDYEAWLLSRGVHATGYVIPAETAVRLKESGFFQLHYFWRHKIAQSLEKQELEQETRGMLNALLIGESGGLSPRIWNLLSKTGTNHLFVVSGLHIGMIAATLLGLLKLFRFNSVWSGCITITGLTVYGFIVGFGLPVQRAFVMAVVGLFFLTSRREVAVWRVLVVTLSLLLALNPFATLSAGFWLSFTAVAGLVVAFSGWQRASLDTMHLLTRTQVTALIVTAPLLLCWVGAFSFVSVLANLVAVPLMAVFIVPLMFAYLCLSVLSVSLLSNTLLKLLAYSLEWMMAGLELLANFNWVYTAPLGIGPIMGLVVLGSIVCLLPKWLVPRWLAVFLWLPIATYAPGSHYFPLKEAYLRVDVLDVGQGLSVIITGPSNTIVFDTGPSFDRRDSGETTVLPMLQQLDRTSIDLLVVSHSDDDHAGGADSIRRAIPIQYAISSHVDFGASCYRGSQQFKDMNVSWYSIEPSDFVSGNDASCVLRIDSPFGSLLLPGDIEEKAEKELLAQIVPVDLLISPHHGSRSSSTPAFINAVETHWVVHSNGYRNRFGHPHSEINSRYRNRGIRQFETATSGALTFIFTEARVRIFEGRSIRPRFWYDPALSQH